MVTIAKYLNLDTSQMKGFTQLTVDPRASS